MTILLILFIVLAAIGAFDVGYYHLFKLRLFERPECHHEQLAHTLGACRWGGFAGVWAACIRPVALALVRRACHLVLKNTGQPVIVPPNE